jgi:nucleoid-associated protein YgaU
VRTYRVCSGDTLIGIARKVYGRQFGDEHLRIYRANRDKLSDPAALSVGQVLVIPPLPGRAIGNRQVALKKPPQQNHYTEMTMVALSKRFGNDRTYVVRSGDCLTSIARRTMGDASKSAVRKLLDANRDRLANPNRLSVGMKLKIPG